MTKIRGFSVVLHDVQNGLQSKEDVQAKVHTLPWEQYVIAEEKYNHQVGSHIHIFLRLKNPVHFSSMLKNWCCWWKSGRVQVDAQRGTMAQGCIYVTNSIKEKHHDPSPIIMLGQEQAKLANVVSHVDVWPTCEHHKYNQHTKALGLCDLCFQAKWDEVLKFIFPDHSTKCLPAVQSPSTLKSAGRAQPPSPPV